MKLTADTIAALIAVRDDEEARRHAFAILCPPPKGPPRAMYHGCLGGIGHYPWNEHGSKAYDLEKILPWQNCLDGGLCPGAERRRERRYESTPEIEGCAALHHRGGWTALAFWDRSVDKRGACNSVFLFEGMHDFDQMVALAKQRFPQVWNRFTFTVYMAPEHFGVGT